MDYQEFYHQLYSPLMRTLGPADEMTIVAIVGFDMGGPLNFCTFGRDAAQKVVTYVSCELAVRSDQQPSSFGRYELLTSCDSESWVRSVLSDAGRMTLDVAFDDGHTLDIGGWVNEGNSLNHIPTIQGLLFKKEYAVTIEGEPYGIMRCIGITRPEMEFAQHRSATALVSRLKSEGVYPHTIVNRRSIL